MTSDAAANTPLRSPRRRRSRHVVLALSLVVVFGWVLPQFIDYGEVVEALAELDTRELAVLTLLAAVRVPTEALMYRAFVPALSLRAGTAAYLSSNFASQLLPPPTASLVQYAYFRREGTPPQAASVAAAGSFV